MQLSKLTCKDASRLLSEAQERRLGLRERLTLRLHLMVCTGCDNFRKQLEFIGTAIGRYRRRDE
ncbi:MAG TPA: zf-HC2 domain-containing protein [Sinorhizobium sp.]|nr:zf-HC2 domain-containing protein [Sinorhizobium sp.]